MLLLFALLLSFVCSSRQFKIIRNSVTYLETNTWLLSLGSLNILLDPVLSAPLDFGIPLLYSGSKVKVDGKQFLKEVSQSIDYVLLSQGLDDHAHTPTLKEIRRTLPGMKYIAPSSALPILQSCGIDSSCVTILRPGETTVLAKGTSRAVSITATAGALLGPPWQQKENGYVLRPADSAATFPSIYYEPHCNYDTEEVAALRADYVITPVVAQELPYFTLVRVSSLSLSLSLFSSLSFPSHTS